VLSVPSLSLAAWVWEGNSDEVLEQGVGHNPATAWPGSSGTAELSAHDVSQFSELWRLSAGDSVYFYPGCGARALYRVVKVEVVRAGEPVYTWPRPALLLETCWPPYTLSATPQRLLVYAELVRYENAGQTPVPYEPQLPSPSFPIGVDPAAYSLGRNYAPMGSMRVSGDPTPRVLQSSLPLKAEEDALQLYFALVKAEREGDRALLSSVAPNVDPSSPPASYLAGPFEYTEPVDVLENFSGDSLTQVELVIGLRSASGEHRMAVVAGAHGSTLWIDRVEER
jgi:LPXTG-site transpeptidase (sortase) family protein